jgi:hypothetical protein
MSSANTLMYNIVYNLLHCLALTFVTSVVLRAVILGITKIVDFLH